MAWVEVVVSRQALDTDVIVFYPDIAQTCFRWYAKSDRHTQVRMTSVTPEAGTIQGAPARKDGTQVKDITAHVFSHSRIWLVVEANHLGRQEADKVLRFFLAKRKSSHHWRFPRHLHVYLLVRAELPQPTSTATAESGENTAEPKRGLPERGA